MTNVAALKARNASRWHDMHMRASRLAQFKTTAERLCAPENKSRYEAVTTRLLACSYQGVPWWFIAIVSEREYGGPPHWDRQLGQGDPLHQVSHNEPKGRGPFLDHPGDVTPGYDAWARCAIDALVDCAPHAAVWSDWSCGGVMTLFEEYNGLGYAARGIASPYVWSGTDQYDAGKFVADHVFDARRVDVQLGCAPILSMMMVIDPGIAFAGAA